LRPNRCLDGRGARFNLACFLDDPLACGTHVSLAHREQAERMSAALNAGGRPSKTVV